MNSYSFAQTLTALLAAGKGILAADESLPTIGKRFSPLGIPSSAETHRAYRELLFTAPGLSAFISGVILFDETIHQSTRGGAPMADYLAAQGIVPGIKVDGGTVDLPRFAKEKVTAGLDGLPERLRQYVELGARFTKWRAVLSIGPDRPSRAALELNAQALARFAGLSQQVGLLPIVEPEVLINGPHTIDQCEAATTLTLQTVFAALIEQRIDLEHMLLKTGMVLSGNECPDQADDETVATATLRCLRRTVPAAVPGIVFLSGGQKEDEASRRLDRICARRPTPWKLTFSYGRALQDRALKTWAGKEGNVNAAQTALLRAAERNSRALHDETHVTAVS